MVLALRDNSGMKNKMESKRLGKNMASKDNYQQKKPFKKILRLIYKAIVKMTPRNRLGDKFVALVNFVIQHKRMPTKKLIFNDYLYGIKTTEEIVNPLRVFVSDKEFVKDYVKAKIGDQYNVPTIAVLHSVEEIKNFSFPSQCCIKPTHASGRVILRQNGEPLDISEIENWFRINYYDRGREANYKTLKPKVIVEPLLFNRSNVEDFKIFCFNGRPRFIQVDIDRYVGHKRKYFDFNWDELDFSIIYPKCQNKLNKPNNFEEMLKVATALSKDFSMIRVDLYSDGQRIYVGELTNVSENASGVFLPPSAELVASELLFQTKF